ncbi:heparinase II/III family protein [Stappia sp. 22II-S9-Z10]|nr:heparinase II/III family protein [Stappia sp. 22II-S9-Z10]
MPQTTLASLLGYGARRTLDRIVATLRASLWRRPAAGIPHRVLFAPETLAEADAAVAGDIYAGVFALAGQSVDTGGRSPFSADPPSEEWAVALHGFGWLHHLEANATELSSTNARALVDEWFAHASVSEVAHRPGVTAERLLNWLVQSPLLLNGADPAFRQRYMRALGRHMRRLERALPSQPRGMARLKVAAALVVAGTSIANEQRLARWALGILGDVVAADILPDGGHVSRSPETLFEALAFLIPVREALARRQQAVPEPLRECVDRMLPMLRFFVHSDGALATFHGARPLPPSTLEGAFAYDDVGGAPIENARYSGYQRLAAERTVVLLDTGVAPPPPFAGRAHASALAIEMSHGPHRLFVSCGALGDLREEWTAVGRATAAQSTLVVDDTSSARLVSRWPLVRWFGPTLYAGPTAVDVRRSALTVKAAHDGYVSAFGLTHERRITLGEDGLALIGEDQLIGQDRLDGRPFAIRFHVGPEVKLKIEKSRKKVLLVLPDGSIWLFAVDQGPQIAVEESILVNAPYRARRTSQLVISGNTLTDDTVRWHIARHAQPVSDDA